jgi:hypothetical protein
MLPDAYHGKRDDYIIERTVPKIKKICYIGVYLRSK